MSWFCNTPEAKKQMKLCEANKCPGCYKCIWIEESAHAMYEHGTPIEEDILVVEETCKYEAIQKSWKEPYEDVNDMIQHIESLFRK